MENALVEDRTPTRAVGTRSGFSTYSPKITESVTHFLQLAFDALFAVFSNLRQFCVKIVPGTKKETIFEHLTLG